jgi:hypothetical protein
MRKEDKINEIQANIDRLERQKYEVSQMTIDDQVQEFLATPVGVELISNHKLTETGNWQISIEVDNKKQALATINCSLEKAIKIAVGLPTFSNWDNGTIEKVHIK